jgi:alpha-N-arabinofuranosidase
VLMQNLGRYLGVGEVTGHGKNTYQAISFHHYTVVGPTWENKGSATDFDTAEYYRTMVKAAEIERILAGHANVMDAYDPDKRVGLVLDEWGTWFDVEPGTNPGFLFQQNTLRDALVASVHFDAFHRHADRLVMANIAQTVNVLQAMLLTDGEALVLTPSYHVFAMNKGHQDAASLPFAVRGATPTHDVDGTALPTFSGSASTRDGHVLVSLSNLDATGPLTVEVDVRGSAVGPPTGRLLSADSLTAHNTATDTPVQVRDLDGIHLEDGVLRVTLPAHSFATVRLPVDA